MTGSGRLLSLCVLALGFVAGPTATPASANAPRQLYNKTIQMSWSVNSVQVDDGGQRRSVNTAASHTVYVSSAGRLFQRGSRANRTGKKQTDNAPGATHNKGGEANNIRFQGNRLVGTTAFAQGARQFVATFDPSFSSCTVSVSFGKESGGIKRRGISGRMLTIESMTASGESCSIREGNPFGE